MENGWIILWGLFGLGLVAGLLSIWRAVRTRSVRSPGPGHVHPPGPATEKRPATVAAKRTYDWPERIGYYVTFRLDGADPVEVEVTQEWYVVLSPGEQGHLTLHDRRFGGFQRRLLK